MNNDVLIRVEGVSKKFCRRFKRSLWYGVRDTIGDMLGFGSLAQGLRHEEFWAVDDVSFELRRGECLGLIGRNGAGKTTLLKMLNGLIKPDRGRIEMHGRIGALIALGAGFNPILTGRENIYINGAVLDLPRSEIDSKIDDIIDFAEIGDFIDSPVQSYSSGMQVRLGFAIATTLKPDVLLLDEVLAVGDANFQAKCYQRIGTLLQRAAVIFVSHSPYHIKKICNHALFLKQGKIAASGFPETVLRTYAARDSNQLQPLSIVDARVARAEMRCRCETLRHGETLKLVLLIDLYEPARCDQGYLNIVDEAGDCHAQAILNDLPLEFDSGSYEIVISVGPLCLSEGEFYGNLLMLTSDGKETLIHLRNSVFFKNRGPINIGASYLPQVVIEITDRRVRFASTS